MENHYIQWSIIHQRCLKPNEFNDGKNNESRIRTRNNLLSRHLFSTHCTHNKRCMRARKMTTANIVRRGLRIVYNSQLNRNWSIFLYVLVDDLVWFGVHWYSSEHSANWDFKSFASFAVFFVILFLFSVHKMTKKKRNTNIFNHEFNETPINGLFLEREPNKLR